MSIKVVHFSTYGPAGGAGRASYTLHQSLRAAGCDSWMLVAQEPVPSQQVLSAFGTDILQRGLLSLRYRRQTHMLQQLKPKEIFHPDRLGTAVVDRLTLPVTPDIIHLQWIAGFLTSHDVWNLWKKYQVPFVWTVMDMAPLTGGCHYSHDCRGFTTECGRCPTLGSENPDDISHRSWLSKNKWLKEVPMTLVGATDWVEERVRASSLFGRHRFVKIPYGKDTSVFRTASRPAIREALHLPQDAQIIFFGMAHHNDARKGMPYLVEAFEILHKTMADAQPPVVLLTAGQADAEQLERLPFAYHQLGSISDDRLLAMAYQAADVFVCPSVDDAGPLMMPESLLCGTPVVAFEGCGGAADLIRPGENGYLAEMRSSADLARAIAQALSAVAAGEITTEHCRDLALQTSTLDAQAARYLDLYGDLLSAKK